MKQSRRKAYGLTFLSRYHYTVHKSKKYLKRQYQNYHLIPMFIGTTCIEILYNSDPMLLIINHLINSKSSFKEYRTLKS